MIANGTLTANGTVNVTPPSGGKQSFPGTFAAWGTFGGGTIAVTAGFYGHENPPVLHLSPIASGSLTAAGAVNIALRCDVLQIALTGATSPSIGYWIG